MNFKSYIFERVRTESHIGKIPVDIAASVLIGALLALINLRYALILSPDSSTYIRWADLLIGHRFNLLAYYDDNQFVSSPVFYTLPVGIIALLKVAIGVHWERIFFAINILALIATIEIFRRSARLLGISALAVAGTLPLFSFTDFILWPHYLLTDTIFAALVMASVYATLLTICNKKGFLIPIVYCALLFLARPSSPPFVFAILLFLVVCRFYFFAIGTVRLLVFLFFMLLATAFIYGYVFEILLSRPSGSEQLMFIGQMIRKGIVIHDRPDTFVAWNPTVFNIARIFLLRIVTYFSPYASTYSAGHIFANCVVLLSVMAGLFAWIGSSAECGENMRKGAHFVLITTLCVAMFHAATLIDFDWRYRFPVIAPMFIFVAAGIDYCIKYFREFRIR